MEGRYFLSPLQVALCPIPRSLWIHRMRFSLLQPQISRTPSALRPVSSFGRHREKGCEYWVWVGAGQGFTRTLRRAGASPPHLCPAGRLWRQSKLGVPHICPCKQPKRWTSCLACDPQKWRWVTLIFPFLTTTANLASISLVYHENLPQEKCFSWKVLFLTS